MKTLALLVTICLITCFYGAAVDKDYIIYLSITVMWIIAFVGLIVYCLTDKK